MRRTVRRRLQRMRKGQDRILPTPEDAAVPRGQLVRHLPLWGGQLLTVYCEWAHQGAVRMSPPVPALVEHVMDRWNDLVRCCVRDPAIPPARTCQGLVWALRPRARLARGLKTSHVAQAFLHLLAGNLDRGEGAVHARLKPFSTKVKQCHWICGKAVCQTYTGTRVRVHSSSCNPPLPVEPHFGSQAVCVVTADASQIVAPCPHDIRLGHALMAIVRQPVLHLRQPARHQFIHIG